MSIYEALADSRSGIQQELAQSGCIADIRILDIGAMEEGEERYHRLIQSGHATVIGFEPNPEQCAKLQKRGGPYHYLPHFVGDGHVAEFHLTRYPGCSSLLKPNARLIDLFSAIDASQPGGNFHVRRTVPVPTVRLDELRPDVCADLIKIDIQGAELMALQNGTETVREALVIESEVEFVPLYEGQALFCDLQAFLREQGFVFHKFLDMAGRAFRPFMPPNPHAPLSQLLWADAIFVRDFTELDRWTDTDLLKGATILDGAYHSYDLAALLLREYDRRKRTGIYMLYLEALRTGSVQPMTCTIKACA